LEAHVSTPLDFAVIPVAGIGTRLLPLTKSQPKEMLSVGRKPVVHHVVEELANSGVKRMLFITGPGKTAIENHFDLNQELITHLRESGREEQLADLPDLGLAKFDLEYFYMRQRRQLGLGHAVLCAKPLLGDQPFVVALGDSIIGLNGGSQIVRRMIDIYEKTKPALVIAFEEVPKEDVVHYGIARPKGPIGEFFDIEDLVEKPSVEAAPSQLAVAARYVCHPDLFDFLTKQKPGKGGEIQLTDAIHAMIKAGRRVLGVQLSPTDRRYDIGNFESYFQTFLEFAFADPDHGKDLRGWALRHLTAGTES
jgi:UTP--glucose-1-phosphate uridylyltransferase